MTPMEALRASTILAADKIGFAPDLGSIETGKLADFIVLDADPLAGHPQLAQDPLGRQERRDVGGGDDEEGLAARGGAADVLLEAGGEVALSCQLSALSFPRRSGLSVLN